MNDFYKGSKDSTNEDSLSDVPLNEAGKHYHRPVRKILWMMDVVYTYLKVDIAIVIDDEIRHYLLGLKNACSKNLRHLVCLLLWIFTFLPECDDSNYR